MSKCGRSMALGSVAVLAGFGLMAKKGSRSSLVKRAELNKMRIYGMVGDADPIEHGGGVVYPSEYGPQLAFWHEKYEEDYYGDSEPVPSPITVYRTDVPEDVMAEYGWVDFESIAQQYGMEMHEMRAWSRHPDALNRANLVYEVARTQGYGEIDHYPIEMTAEEIQIRWPAINGSEKLPPSIRDSKLGGFIGGDLVPSKYALRDLEDLLNPEEEE